MQPAQQHAPGSVGRQNLVPWVSDSLPRVHCPHMLHVGPEEEEPKEPGIVEICGKRMEVYKFVTQVMLKPLDSGAQCN